MAYFPNGASLERFERDVCSGCVDRSTVEKECPVITAHVMAPPVGGARRDQWLLDLLIPTNGRTCSLFYGEGR